MYCSYMCVRGTRARVCVWAWTRRDRIGFRLRRRSTVCLSPVSLSQHSVRPSIFPFSFLSSVISYARSFLRDRHIFNKYIPPTYFLPASLSIADRYQEEFPLKDRNHPRVSNIALIFPRFHRFDSSSVIGRIGNRWWASSGTDNRCRMPGDCDTRSDLDRVRIRERLVCKSVIRCYRAHNDRNDASITPSVMSHVGSN